RRRRARVAEADRDRQSYPQQLVYRAQVTHCAQVVAWRSRQECRTTRVSGQKCGESSSHQTSTAAGPMSCLASTWCSPIGRTCVQHERMCIACQRCDPRPYVLAVNNNQTGPNYLARVILHTI